VYCFGGCIGNSGMSCNGGSVIADMWKYDISVNSWTWIWGSSTPKEDVRYSAGLGISSTINNPGARVYMGGWSSISQKSIFLFGGQNLNEIVLGDMWKFDISTLIWTWVHGVLDSRDVLGKYFSQEFDTVSYPRSRFNFGSTVLSPKHPLQELFVLFGGYSGTNSAMNDLWYYSPSTNQFRWVLGSSFYPGFDTLATYSSLMNESSTVEPGCRRTSVALPFFDESAYNSSYLFLFGGTLSGVGATVRSDVMRFRIQFPCLVGFFLNSSNQCSRCPSGKYSDKLSDHTFCQNCSAGSYNNESGLTFCSTCPIGTYSSSSGRSTCLLCAPGAYTSNAGAAECQPCPDGTIAESTSCTDCLTGTYSRPSQGFTSCIPCPEVLVRTIEHIIAM
jgi:hypothetical protein